ncbi:MAG: site-specific DNA-methyltransferase [Roseiflexus sp.]|nr:site-specific DNA-methyltransferase [Roseiflexus sp.]
MQQLGLSAHLTHKANLKHTRYGWLRLTPAYSVHLVQDLLSETASHDAVVLDPFCGTGTTALACAERGIPVDTTDINPFLLWLTKTKVSTYESDHLNEFRSIARHIARLMEDHSSDDIWIPPIHQIEKWWNGDVLRMLGAIMGFVRQISESYPEKVVDLLKVAFCRTMIAHSSASFNHQSMSFKPQNNLSLFHRAVDDMLITWESAVEDLYISAQSEVRVTPGIFLCDARRLSTVLPHNYYTCVITSPPYPNRMSYIRELRPYMYWLGYLHNGREAGELDWQAIGGTWGIATSNVSRWSPSEPRTIPHPGFLNTLAKISEKSDLLARYVHKYFYDMVEHINDLFVVTRSGGSIHYIVGNSKFYDVIVPVEAIFASMFSDRGFVDVDIRPIRKRTSKKELYEYLICARKP